MEGMGEKFAHGFGWKAFRKHTAWKP